jgi:hypothetical protein
MQPIQYPKAGLNFARPRAKYHGIDCAITDLMPAIAGALCWDAERSDLNMGAMAKHNSIIAYTLYQAFGQAPI